MGRKAQAKNDATKKSSSESDQAFLGVRIRRDVYKRLYRAKATLEFEAGDFYGIGRLVERVLVCGLDVVEREMKANKQKTIETAQQGEEGNV